MARPFTTTLTGQVTAVGAITFNQIDTLGAVTTGVTSFTIPTGQVLHLSVLDGSNNAGAFCFRINFRYDETHVVPLIDVVSPQKGEVTKFFAIEAPLLEVEGDGTRAIEATCVEVEGAPAVGHLVIVLNRRSGTYPG